MNKLFLIPIIFGMVLSMSFVLTNFAQAAPQRDDAETECAYDLVLVYRIQSNNFVCVSEETANRWVEYGMAEIVAEAEKQEKPAEKQAQKETEKQMKEKEAMKEKDAMKEKEKTEKEMKEKEMKKEHTDGVSMLFVQTATSGSFTEADGGHVLILNGVASTIYFSDRPHRMAGNMDTGAFVDEWAAGADSFADDPPNAAITVLGADDAEDNVVVELTNPVYDAEAMTLQYDAMILEGDDNGDYFATNDGQIPAEFDAVSVFIDSSASAGGHLCVWKICISGGVHGSAG